MNIHHCQVWWVTPICLYTLYPFVSDEFYGVIYGLHKIFKMILKVPVDKAKLIAYRPTMIANLKLYEAVVPPAYHGILLHNIPHIYDFVIMYGCSVLLFAMYLFERTVAMYNRMINDRKNPEENLCNNIAFRVSLMNVTQSAGSGIGGSSLRDQLDAVPPAIRLAVGLDQFAPVYKVAVYLSLYVSLSFSLSILRTHTHAHTQTHTHTHTQYHTHTHLSLIHI